LPDISGIAILRWTREHMEAPPRGHHADQP
jgi:hypothetical protein